MRVIENSRKKDIKVKFPIEHKCEHCGSVLEVERDDIEEGYLGQAYVICPICHQEAYLGIEELDNIIKKSL